MRSFIFSDPSNDRDLHIFLLAFVATELFMLVFFLERKVYDMSTAAFFAWMLGLLARRKFLAYYLVFPFACLNRETAFLMIFVFAHHFQSWYRPQWIYGAIYQTIVFLLIRMALMVLYAHNVGIPFLFRLPENIQDFAIHPWLSLVHWFVFVLVAWLCTRDWHAKPILLRSAFTVLVPSLLVLYLLFGWAFELRVFAEVYPVVFALGTWRIW